MRSAASPISRLSQDSGVKKAEVATFRPVRCCNVGKIPPFSAISPGFAFDRSPGMAYRGML